MWLFDMPFLAGYQRLTKCMLSILETATCNAFELLPAADAEEKPPQWGVRGGGGRGRDTGGRFKGLDPVVPVTDPEILSSIADFYGIAQDFPLWDQLITRYTFASAPVQR